MDGNSFHDAAVDIGSIAARSSHGVWRHLTGANRRDISPEAWRFPALIAGVLSVGLLGLAGAQAGMPRAGLLAACLAALHPWHISHSVEVRGYAFVFLFSILLLMALMEVVRRGQWRWCAAAAISTFLLLYTYPGALYTVVAANAVAASFLFWKCRGNGRWIVIGRLLVTHALACGLLLQLIAPCIPQMRDYMDNTTLDAKVAPDLVPNVFSHLATGMPWNLWEAENPWMHNTAGDPAAIAWILLSGTLALLGLWLGRRDPLVPMAAVLAAMPTLGYLASAFSGTYVFVWYAVYATPGLLLLVSIGLEKLPLGRFMPLTTLPVLVLFAGATQEQRLIVRTHPKEPTREAVRTIQAAHQAEPGITSMLWRNAHLYDTSFKSYLTLQELLALLQESEVSGKPLYTMYGYRPAIKAVPELYNVLSDPAKFEVLATLPGLQDENSTYRVLKSRRSRLFPSGDRSRQLSRIAKMQALE